MNLFDTHTSSKLLCVCGEFLEIHRVTKFHTDENLAWSEMRLSVIHPTDFNEHCEAYRTAVTRILNGEEKAIMESLMKRSLES